MIPKTGMFTCAKHRTIFEIADEPCWGCINESEGFPGGQLSWKSFRDAINTWEESDYKRSEFLKEQWYKTH